MENLSRFIEAQEGNWKNALDEIKAGRKRSHWMWFIVPQLRGLGFSSAARFYGIEGLQEAKDYLAHPVLGKRLEEICEALVRLSDNDASKIFGYPDDVKLRSSMTLFASAAERKENVFIKVLEKYFGSVPDHRTLKLLNKDELQNQ